MTNKHTTRAAGLLLLLSNTLVVADDAETWFLRPYLGLSQMSDLDPEFRAIDGLNGTAEVELDDGFSAGIGIGYRYSERIAVELGWEYRAHDSATTLAGLSEFDDGNYAANIIYLNGHYLFAPSDNWQPYAGGGITWVEEVDIDLERGGEELSFSADGDLGYQLFAGVSYVLNADWKIHSELRYGKVADIDLKGEGNAGGEFIDLDYETTTLQLGLVYDF